MKIEYTLATCCLALAGALGLGTLGHATSDTIAGDARAVRAISSAPLSAQAGALGVAEHLAHDLYRAVPQVAHPREIGAIPIEALEARLQRAARSRVPPPLGLGDSLGAQLAEDLFREGIDLANRWRETFDPSPYLADYQRPPRDEVAELIAAATHPDMGRKIGPDYGLDDFLRQFPKPYQRRVELGAQIFHGGARPSAIKRYFGVDAAPLAGVPNAREILGALPDPRSQAFRELVAQARGDLARSGYAIVPTSRYLTTELREAVLARMGEFHGSYGRFDVRWSTTPWRANAIAPHASDLVPFRRFDGWRRRFAGELMGVEASSLDPQPQLYLRGEGARPVVDGVHLDQPSIVMATDFGEAGGVVYPTERIGVRAGLSRDADLPYPRDSALRVHPEPGDTLVLLGTDARVAAKSPSAFRELIGDHRATVHGSRPGDRARLLALTGFHWQGAPSN